MGKNHILYRVNGSTVSAAVGNYYVLVSAAYAGSTDSTGRDAGSSNWHWVSICYVGLDAHSTGCVSTILALLLVNPKEIPLVFCLFKRSLCLCVLLLCSCSWLECAHPKRY